MSIVKFKEAYDKFGISHAPVEKNYSPEVYGASFKRCSILKQGDVSYDYRSCSDQEHKNKK